MLKRILGSGLLSVLAIWAGPLAAQENNASTYQRPLSVYERERPAYEAEGVEAGSFMVYPGADVSLHYNDNIFANPSNEQHDTIRLVAPSLLVESDWAVHSLMLDVNAELASYQANSNENYEDFTATVEGQLDIQRDMFISGYLDYEKLHEDRASSDDEDGQDLVTFDRLTAGVGFTRALGRISLQAATQLRVFDYNDVRNAQGAELNNDDRDRDELSGQVRLAYEFKPGYQAFVRTSYFTKDYSEQTDDSGFNRDSDGYEASVGGAIDLGGKTVGEIYVGYLERDYDDTQLDDVGDMNYGASVLWNVTDLTSIKLALARSIEETTLNDASGYMSSIYALEVQHELRRHLLLRASVGLRNNDFGGIVGATVADREDDIFGFEIGARYYFNEHFSLDVEYLFEDRSSNRNSQDYTRNIFMLRVNSAL